MERWWIVIVEHAQAFYTGCARCQFKSSIHCAVVRPPQDASASLPRPAGILRPAAFQFQSPVSPLKSAIDTPSSWLSPCQSPGAAAGLRGGTSGNWLPRSAGVFQARVARMAANARWNATFSQRRSRFGFGNFHFLVVFKAFLATITYKTNEMQSLLNRVPPTTS